VAQQAEVTAVASGPGIEHCSLELVTEGGQLPLEVTDEDAEVGLQRRRVHLRDEQDPHAREV